MPLPAIKRRITKASIEFISLCPKGASTFTTLFKALDEADDKGAFEFATLSKQMEKGEIVSLVYAPESVDAQGDVASEEVIKEMSQSFLRNKGDIDIRHDSKALGPDKAYVSESFIVQKDDPRFADTKDADGKPVKTEGAWAVVIKIEDEELKKLYREGKWEGISMGGRGKTERVDPENSQESGMLSKVLDILKQVMPNAGLQKQSNQDTPMTKEDKKDVAEMIAKAVADASKTTGNAEYSGDLKDAKALKKHLEGLEKAEGKKVEVDLGNVEAVEKHLKALKKLEGNSIDLEDAEEVKKLLKSLMEANGKESKELGKLRKEAELAKSKFEKLERKSNQHDPESDGEVRLFAKEKDDMDDFAKALSV